MYCTTACYINSHAVNNVKLRGDYNGHFCLFCLFIIISFCCG